VRVNLKLVVLIVVHLLNHVSRVVGVFSFFKVNFVNFDAAYLTFKFLNRFLEFVECGFVDLWIVLQEDSDE